MAINRIFLLGPVTLEEWLDRMEDVEGSLKLIEESYPWLDVRTYTIVTEYTNLFYIRYDIHESEDY